jgi:hypothetical protein
MGMGSVYPMALTPCKTEPERPNFVNMESVYHGAIKTKEVYFGPAFLEKKA